MRWQAPSERTQMILLSPVIAVCLPPLLVMVAMIWCWQRFYLLIAPSSEWHPWFAWRPVRHFNDVDWIWLERCERMWHGFSIGCIYRFAQGMQLREDGRSPAEAEGLQPGPRQGMRPEMTAPQLNIQRALKAGESDG